MGSTVYMASSEERMESYSDVFHASHATLYGKGRQDQNQGIDDAPGEGDPGGHAEVASSIDTAQEATDDVAGNQGFNGTDQGEDDGSDPDELPVAPLYGHGKSSSNQVDANDVNDGPEQGEAPYVMRVVEV